VACCDLRQFAVFIRYSLAHNGRKETSGGHADQPAVQRGGDPGRAVPVLAPGTLPGVIAGSMIRAERAGENAFGVK
jgi:hypothetical protein